jgi:hypothetical protein
MNDQPQSRISAALRFWEPMRALYNAALFAAFFPLGGAELLSSGEIRVVASLIVLAAAANLLYCIAYPIDLLVQSSDWREGWRKWGRIILFLAGLALALTLEYLTLLAMIV